MAATGAGKSVIAGHMVSSAVQKGLRVLFVVDTLELVNQITETFERYGLKTAVMQGRHERTDPARMVQVCMAQTLNNRLKRVDQWGPDNYPVGLIVIDEAHCRFRSHKLLAELYPQVPMIGLSATPFAKGMADLYDDLIIAIPMQQLIDEGYLCPFRVYAPGEPDMTGVATKPNGDWTDGGAASRYTQQIHADVVSTWKRLGEDRQTIGFGCTVAHARDLAREFQQAGIKAAHISGYDSQSPEGMAERDQIIRDFKAGEIRVLFNCAILTKGFDYPDVGCIIDARPTKSLQLHLQKLGRGLRVSDKQPDCIILDHAGNALRNGFPTDPLPDELDDGGKKSSEAKDRKPADEPLPKACPSCSYVKPVGMHKCPSCGFAPEKRSDVATVNGSLVEITSGKRKEYSTAEKKGWYGGFIHIASQRGYKHGWAYAQFIKKFGHKPHGYEKQEYPPMPEVESWVRSQAIRYAKGKAKANAA
jgi:superfamily II DNA or RNA helicase